MEKYDYYKEMENDVRSFIENWDGDKDYETLYDAMWVSDGVTGNGSGSYTFSAWEAQENVCHNLDLLEDACGDFGCDVADLANKGAEWADVTIRCYLLGQVLNDILVDYANKEEEEEEEENV